MAEWEPVTQFRESPFNLSEPHQVVVIFKALLLNYLDSSDPPR
jgi:hypothetical protein